MAGEKPYVTDLDFEYAHLPKETVRFLQEAMPETSELPELEEGMERPANGTTKAYDCESSQQSSEVHCLYVGRQLFLRSCFCAAMIKRASDKHVYTDDRCCA